jgi:hypothetical protein
LFYTQRGYGFKNIGVEVLDLISDKSINEDCDDYPYGDK